MRLIKLRSRRHTVNLSYQLIDLILHSISVSLGQSTVRSLHGQLCQSLNHVVHLVQGAVCGLNRADAVLGVQGCLGKTADLLAHLLTDGKACRIVSRTVDLVAG